MSSTRATIAQLLADGLTRAEIARRLSLATTTVDYHAARLRRPAVATTARETDPVEHGRSQVPTRRLVAELMGQGLSRLAIARTLGISRSTVSYHARTIDGRVDERAARRYDWPVIQRYYDSGHSMRQCAKRFGFSSQSWHAAVNRGAIRPRPSRMPIEELLSKPRNRSHVKARLLAAALKKPFCEMCGIGEWRERPLSLALHHMNGNRHDNRLENLQLLCPNCHSQTESFSGRNRPDRGKLELAQD